MTRSEIELIDGENYGIVRKDRISSNQIKTRPASFDAISKVWRDFRLKFYTDKLNSEKESALTQNFEVNAENKLVDSAVEQISNKSLVIARLEEKIKILSKESVPANYVDNRAIKLRKKMMDNLVNNCGNAYSIGIDKMDEVFENSEIVNETQPTNEISDTNSIIENVDVVASNNESSDTVDVVASNNESLDTVDNYVAEEAPISIDEQQNINVDVTSGDVETSVGDNNSLATEVEVGDISSIDKPEIQSNETVSDAQLEVIPIEESEAIIDRSEEAGTAEPVVNNDAVESDAMIDSSNISGELSYASDITDDDTVIDNYDAGDDVLIFDNDEPALFELINPNENENSDEVIVSDVKTDYENNLSDTPIISDSYDDISVSRNGSSKAKIDRYKEHEDSKNKLKPFKIVTFKDIFRPSNISYDNIIKPLVVGDNLADNDRYVPLIVPERNDTNEKVNVVSQTNDSELDVSNVEEMKNKYLQLQKLLKSKTARLNSVRAEREAIISEVENSSKDKEKATASLNKKYQLMAKYIGDLQRQCAIVDDETASNENDINNSRQIIEDNRNVVDSTQRAIEELDDILRDSTSRYEDEDDYHIRRAA